MKKGSRGPKSEIDFGSDKITFNYLIYKTKLLLRYLKMTGLAVKRRTLEKTDSCIIEIPEHSRSFRYSDGGYEIATVGIEDLWAFFVHDVADEPIGGHHIYGTLPL